MHVRHCSVSPSAFSILLIGDDVLLLHTADSVEGLEGGAPRRHTSMLSSKLRPERHVLPKIVRMIVGRCLSLSESGTRHLAMRISAGTEGHVLGMKDVCFYCVGFVSAVTERCCHVQPIRGIHHGMF